MKPGEQASVHDCSRFTRSPYARDGLCVFRLAPEDIELARRALLKRVQAGTEGPVNLAPSWNPIADLGRRLARTLGWAMPIGARARRDVRVGAHTDDYPTVPCRTILIWLTKRCEGGHLVIDDARLAVACEDGVVVGFNGQERLHGTTEFELGPGGYRITVNFFSPQAT